MLPGITSEQATLSRSVLLTDHGELRLPRSLVLDKDRCFDCRSGTQSPYSIVLPGTILGKNTASGKWAPAIYGTVGGSAGPTGDIGSSATTIYVSPAVAAELLRQVAAGTLTLASAGNATLIGAPTASGTVAVINVQIDAIAADGAITIHTAPGAVVVGGSFLVPSGGEGLDDAGDGGIGNGLIVLGDGDGSGVQMLENNQRVDRPVKHALAGGMLKTAHIANWPAASLTTLNAYLKARLRAAGQQFIFDDELN